ncbi:MAG: hypothetical protein ACRELE_04915 [Gemmatimonadales bacterium]
MNTIATDVPAGALSGGALLVATLKLVSVALDVPPELHPATAAIAIGAIHDRNCMRTRSRWRGPGRNGEEIA